MNFLFFLFSSLIISSGILVISSRNPVHSILFLVLAFINIVFLLIFLEAEFLALIFLAVYAGAVAILFLFIVMMLNVRILELSKDLVHYFPIVGFFAFLFLLNIFTMLFNKDIISLLDNGLSNQYSYTNWFNYVDTVTTIDYFGHLLYTHYLYFFLVSGIILLVSMIGAIILTSQINDKDYKEQDISQQLSRNSKNSIFLVKVKK